MQALYSIQVRTHVGGVRQVNEDAVSTALDWQAALNLDDETLGLRGHLFAVADGMGGHAAGEVASRLAMDQLFRTYYTLPWTEIAEILLKAIEAANLSLITEADRSQGYAGMGTTLVAAVLHGEILTIANVGDSRAYVQQNGELRQISHDHSWVAEQIEAGVLSPEEAAHHPYRNVITRSLGPDRDPTADLFSVTLEPGDQVLLCSDGLSNLLSKSELQQFLAAYPTDETADILLERALERGAPDNVSFAILDFLGQSPRSRRLWPWLLAVVIALFLLGLAGRDLWFGLWDRSPLDLITPTSTMSGSQIQQSSLTLTPSMTATPAPTQPSPLPTPTPASYRPFIPAGPSFEVRAETLPPAQPLRYGGVERDGDVVDPIPFVFYLEGPGSYLQVEPQTIALVMPQRIPGSDGVQRYILPARGGWLRQTSLKAGERLRVIAHPRDLDVPAESVRLLDPLLIMDQNGTPLWVKGQDLVAWLDANDPVWVFTTVGPAGSNSLLPDPIHSEASIGDSVAWQGRWTVYDSELLGRLVFEPLHDVPFAWDGTMYRQPDR